MSAQRSDLVATAALLAVFVAVLLAMRFHLCLNDFWAWSFFASRMSFADVATWHNGFMPPGYALFLKLAGPGREVAAAFAATLVAVGIAALATLRLARHGGVRGAGPIAALMLLVFSPFVASGLTAGPDMVVTALVSTAALLAFGGGSRAALIAGVLFGLATLVRGHALLGAFATVVALLLSRRTAIAARMAVGVAAGVLVQVLVNLAAGEPAWSNAQAFNVYKMVHGMDWHAPVVPDDLSVLGVFRDDPAAFLREWAGAAVREGVWLLGPALAWLHARRHGLEDLRRLAGFSILVGILYTGPVSLGDSPRAVVVIAALVIAPVAGLVADLGRRGPSGAGLAMALVIAAGVALSVQSDRAFLAHNFGQARDFAALEQALSGHGQVRARDVFTDDFDLYFSELEGRRPLTKGGWGLIGIEGWTEEFPQLPTGDRSAFLESCGEHGVRFLALTRRSRRLGPEFSRFYHDPTAAGLTVVGVYGEFVLLELPPSARPNEEARP